MNIGYPCLFGGAFRAQVSRQDAAPTGFAPSFPDHWNYGIHQRQDFVAQDLTAYGGDLLGDGKFKDGRIKPSDICSVDFKEPTYLKEILIEVETSHT